MSFTLTEELNTDGLDKWTMRISGDTRYFAEIYVFGGSCMVHVQSSSYYDTARKQRVEGTLMDACAVALDLITTVVRRPTHDEPDI